jgi:hypothetical protein
MFGKVKETNICQLKCPSFRNGKLLQKRSFDDFFDCVLVGECKHDGGSGGQEQL